MAGMSGLGDAVLFLIGGSWRCPFLMPSSLYSFSFAFAFFSNIRCKVIGVFIWSQHYGGFRS